MASIKFNVNGTNFYIPTGSDGNYQVTCVDDINVIPHTYKQMVYFKDVETLKVAPSDCSEATIELNSGRIVTIFQHEQTKSVIVYSF